MSCENHPTLTHLTHFMLNSSPQLKSLSPWSESLQCLNGWWTGLESSHTCWSVRSVKESGGICSELVASSPFLQLALTERYWPHLLINSRDTQRRCRNPVQRGLMKSDAISAGQWGATHALLSGGWTSNSSITTEDTSKYAPCTVSASTSGCTGKHSACCSLLFSLRTHRKFHAETQTPCSEDLETSSLFNQ